ncbi:hypothetical protein AXG93_2587s1330 [Marchantia polymorpha subsp. ruderalis]|uniref:Nucleoside diphosphate kinase n=1 Tax=Marchantia polymorpha subsp. ruderalis TaxID=1480154 RepID=A0A176WQL2_MARPO|nr:hypothetical protein AXG93_2587s1330 [Marchantia polymorpha subsp. ruderalis]
MAAMVVVASTAATGLVGALRCEAQRPRQQQQQQQPSQFALRASAGAGASGQSLRWDSSSLAGSGARLLSYGRRPNGQQRISSSRLTVNAVGDIISRFERKGFALKGLKLFQTPQDLAEEHYSELKERPFFPALVKYIVSGPVVWEGPGVVASARKLIGATNPLNAEPGTIRGDFAIVSGRNVVHGSDSPANGEREIALWFKEGELVDWEPTVLPWVLEL